MLSSITPLGQRGHATRWRLVVGSYIAASAAGGVALGALSALVGLLGRRVLGAVDLSPAVTLVGVAVALGALLALDILGRLPTNARQVDEAWRTAYRDWVVGVGFGIQLGFGLVTIVTTATTYAVVLVCAASADLRVGMLLGGVFGVARALPSLVVARAREPRHLRAIFRRLDRGARAADVTAKVALASAVTAVAAAAAFGGT